MSCDFEEIHYPAIKQIDILKFESKVKVYKHLYRGPSFSFLSCNFICVLQYFLLLISTFSNQKGQCFTLV